MENEFDRGLFATVLLALALLMSVTSVARFPAALRLSKPVVALSAMGERAAPNAELFFQR